MTKSLKTLKKAIAAEVNVLSFLDVCFCDYTGSDVGNSSVLGDLPSVGFPIFGVALPPCTVPGLLLSLEATPVSGTASIAMALLLWSLDPGLLNIVVASLATCQSVVLAKVMRNCY